MNWLKTILFGKAKQNVAGNQAGRERSHKSALKTLMGEEFELYIGLQALGETLGQPLSSSGELGQYPRVGPASVSRTEDLDYHVWFVNNNLSFLKRESPDHCNARRAYKACREHAERIADLLGLPKPSIMNGGLEEIWGFSEDYVARHALTSPHTNKA